MIDYGLFRFAGAPRTATTWIRHAADAVGLRAGGSVHVPHEGRNGTIRLSTVRHPCEWLRSYWTTIWPGQIQIDEVDSLHKACEGAKNFDDFIRKYLDAPWRVGIMFDEYGADMVIRVEDLPWAFVEFLESVGVPKRMRERCLLIGRPNEGRREKPRWNPSLLAKVEEAEWGMIEKYDYDLI